jgi:O-acetyl-ADP-ribose deacetylase (regulator of RNase III)
MQTIPGDLIALAKTGRFDVIAHGCNCFCTMGAGIAKTIKAHFPAAYAADLLTTKGDRTKLGTCTSAVMPAHGNLVVVNAYTQFDWRGAGVKVDYDAVASCMRWIKTHHAGTRIGLPKIGAGLAGGDWQRIADIIGKALAGEQVTVVEYLPSSG